MAGDSEDEEAISAPIHSRHPGKFLPQSLADLFGGTARRSAVNATVSAGDVATAGLATRRSTGRQVPSEEALFLQLMAAAHDSEDPDDGELEGSGDNYDG